MSVSPCTTQLCIGLTSGSLEMELPLQVLCAESLVPLKTWPRLKQLRIQGNPLTFTCKGKPQESPALPQRV